MKYILSLLAIWVSAIASAYDVAWNNPVEIFKSSPAINIVGLTGTDSHVTITLTSKTRIPLADESMSAYIVDDGGSRHHVTSFHDNGAGSGNTGIYGYTLEFDSINVNSQCFDLYIDGIVDVLGIHKSSIELNIPNPTFQIDESEVAEDLYKDSISVVNGKISGLTNISNNLAVVPAYFSYEDKDTAIVDGSLSYSLNIRLNHPSLVELVLINDGKMIESLGLVYLRPGEVVDLCSYVSKDSWKENVITSQSNLPTYSKLMNYIFSLNRVPYETYRALHGNQFADYFTKTYQEELVKMHYYCWRHHLNGYEAELYKNNVDMFYAASLLELIDNQGFDVMNLLNEYIMKIEPNNPVMWATETFNHFIIQFPKYIYLQIDPPLAPIDLRETNRGKYVLQFYELCSNAINKMFHTNGHTLLAQSTVAFGAEGLISPYAESALPQSDDALHNLKQQLLHPYAKSIAEKSYNYYYKFRQRHMK